MSAWKSILGWEGMYEVSDDGQVRSLPRRDSRGCKRQGRVLKQKEDVYGYMQVSLSRNSSPKTFRVHVLVLEAFRCPRPEGAVGMHLDGDSQNNEPGNLAWGTQSENLRMGVVHKTIPEGENAPHTKMTNDQIRRLCEDLCKGMTQLEASRKYSLHQSSISKIVLGKSWKSVSEPYLVRMQAVRRRSGQRNR